jgi:hypothetical protein
MKVEKRQWEDGRTVYTFYCKGCGCHHYFDKRWTFNGDMDKPTFSPSLLVRTGHYHPDHKSDKCWCTYNAEHKDELAPFECTICHSFVTDGKIQYLRDCTHELAGQTIELDEIE